MKQKQGLKKILIGIGLISIGATIAVVGHRWIVNTGEDEICDDGKIY